MNANNILLVIKDYLPRLSVSQKKVGQFILNYPERTLGLNIKELAKFSRTSPATVSRFCQILGIEGYAQLKLTLSSQLNRDKSSNYTDITANESVSAIKTKLLEQTTYYMNETNKTVNDDAIDDVANLIQSAQKIFIFGIGASAIVAQDFSQKFSRVGKTIVCGSDLHEFVAAMASADAHNIFVGITNSGETRELQRLFQIARQLNMATILITSNQKYQFQALVDYYLFHAVTQEAPLRSGATFSLLNQLYLLDILFLRYISKDYEFNLEKLKQSKSAMKLLL